VDIVLADTHGPILGKAQASPNLSLLYLATYAKAHRPDLRFHYIPQRHSWSYHLELIARVKPSLYAVSFTSYGAPTAFKMVRAVKARYPEIKVICGGPHVTPCAQDTLTRSGCDVCVIGEGEATFLELIDRLEDIPGNSRDIRGIAYF
jgi:radical SAM superfamily enzyme YgiQ (UPF0313 family)